MARSKTAAPTCRPDSAVAPRTAPGGPDSGNAPPAPGSEPAGAGSSRAVPTNRPRLSPRRYRHLGRFARRPPRPLGGQHQPSLDDPVRRFHPSNSHTVRPVPSGSVPHTFPPPPGSGPALLSPPYDLENAALSSPHRHKPTLAKRRTNVQCFFPIFSSHRDSPTHWGQSLRPGRAGLRAQRNPTRFRRLRPFAKPYLAKQRRSLRFGPG